MRPGMHIDSVEQFLIRQDNMPWAKCDGVRGSIRRCERGITWIAGRLEAVTGPDGRVLYLSFAPSKAEYGTGRDLSKALMTFDGRLCTGTSRPCPALIQLLDWHAAQNYAQLSVP